MRRKRRRLGSSSVRDRAKYDCRREFSACCCQIRHSLGLPGGMLTSATSGLVGSLEVIKSDSFLLLQTTALFPALFGAVKAYPIMGFLATVLLTNPNGMGWVSNSHGVESFAGLGLVLFLFEMGIHLHLQTLMKMRVDMFILVLSHFFLTSLAIGGISFKVSGMYGAA